jgi:DNA (cytosine-5)-methyltransferase 1
MPKEIWSFFSGAMGLDLGLESAGLAPTLCVEMDRQCCDTIRFNRPSITLIPKDVTLLSESDLRLARRFDGDVHLMVGGPPCQSFSSGGRRAALSDPRGNLIYEYLRLISSVKPEYFIFENVANIVTAAVRHRRIVDRPGQHWSLKRYTAHGTPNLRLHADELSGTAARRLLGDVESLGYAVSFAVLDASEFGAPQRRLRFVMLGSRDGTPLSLPDPTHGSNLKPFVTVRDVIKDLQSDPGLHSEYTPEMRKLFEMVPPGGNWRTLPANVQRRALGGAWKSGGGKTGFFRRLGWDQPSPTITGRANRKASALCHPSESRPLSVRECARLQGFPDSWQFAGAMNQQYMQIGNAVPLQLGSALGSAILSPKPLKVPDPEQMLEAAVQKLRAAARNKLARRGTEPAKKAATA